MKILDSTLVLTSSLGAIGGMEMQGRAQGNDLQIGNGDCAGACMEGPDGGIECLYNDEHCLADELLQPWYIGMRVTGYRVESEVWEKGVCSCTVQFPVVSCWDKSPSSDGMAIVSGVGWFPVSR